MKHWFIWKVLISWLLNESERGGAIFNQSFNTLATRILKSDWETSTGHR